MKIHVKQSGCRLEIYRDDGKGGAYALTRSVDLNTPGRAAQGPDTRRKEN